MADEPPPEEDAPAAAAAPEPPVARPTLPAPVGSAPALAHLKFLANRVTLGQLHHKSGSLVDAYCASTDPPSDPNSMLVSDLFDGVGLSPQVTASILSEIDIGRTGPPYSKDDFPTNDGELGSASFEERRIIISTFNAVHGFFPTKVLAQVSHSADVIGADVVWGTQEKLLETVVKMKAATLKASGGTGEMHSTGSTNNVLLPAKAALSANNIGKEQFDFGRLVASVIFKDLVLPLPASNVPPADLQAVMMCFQRLAGKQPEKAADGSFPTADLTLNQLPASGTADFEAFTDEFNLAHMVISLIAETYTVPNDLDAKFRPCQVTMMNLLHTLVSSVTASYNQYALTFGGQQTTAGVNLMTEASAKNIIKSLYTGDIKKLVTSELHLFYPRTHIATSGMLLSKMEPGVATECLRGLSHVIYAVFGPLAAGKGVSETEFATVFVSVITNFTSLNSGGSVLAEDGKGEAWITTRIMLPALEKGFFQPLLKSMRHSDLSAALRQSLPTVESIDDIMVPETLTANLLSRSASIYQRAMELLLSLLSSGDPTLKASYKSFSEECIYTTKTGVPTDIETVPKKSAKTKDGGEPAGDGKAKPCRNHQKGRCKKGSDCTFSHADESSPSKKSNRAIPAGLECYICRGHHFRADCPDAGKKRSGRHARDLSPDRTARGRDRSRSRNRSNRSRSRDQDRDHDRDRNPNRRKRSRSPAARKRSRSPATRSHTVDIKALQHQFDAHCKDVRCKSSCLTWTLTGACSTRDRCPNSHDVDVSTRQVRDFVYNCDDWKHFVTKETHGRRLLKKMKSEFM